MYDDYDDSQDAPETDGSLVRNALCAIRALMKRKSAMSLMKRLEAEAVEAEEGMESEEDSEKVPFDEKDDPDSEVHYPSDGGEPAKNRKGSGLAILVGEVVGKNRKKRR